MTEFNLTLHQKEAIAINTATLLDIVRNQDVEIQHLIELEQIAIDEEEYEVAVSIRDVINILNSENKIS